MMVDDRCRTSNSTVGQPNRIVNSLNCSAAKNLDHFETVFFLPVLGHFLVLLRSFAFHWWRISACVWKYPECILSVLCSFYQGLDGIRMPYLFFQPGLCHFWSFSVTFCDVFGPPFWYFLALFLSLAAVAKRASHPLLNGGFGIADIAVYYVMMGQRICAAVCIACSRGDVHWRFVRGDGH